MIGVFDSGRGGENALAALRKQLPRADILLYADRAHLPYGTKSEEALLPLVMQDIEVLRRAGAEKILVGCCTASTVFDALPPAYKAGVFPILNAVCKAAVTRSRTHKYALLATKRTVHSGAFATRLSRLDPSARLSSIVVGELVPLAEAGITDAHDERVRVVCEKISPVLAEADTVILGCTHFSLFRETFRRVFPRKTWIGSAEEGARAFAACLTAKEAAGHGDTVRMSS